MPIDNELKDMIEEWCTELQRHRAHMYMKGVDDDDAIKISKNAVIDKLNLVMDADVSAFNQASYGCCGFAAVIMALAYHSPAKFQELCKAVFSDAADGYWPGTTSTVRVASHLRKSKALSLRRRLSKREKLSNWNQHNGNILPDISIAVGLMILFKEYARNQTPPDPGNPSPTLSEQEIQWEACFRYSQLFAGFQRAGKLELKAEADKVELQIFISIVREWKKAGHILPPRLETFLLLDVTMSQKRGDLALPYQAVPMLANFVFTHIFRDPTLPPPAPSASDQFACRSVTLETHAGDDIWGDATTASNTMVGFLADMKDLTSTAFEKRKTGCINSLVSNVEAQIAAVGSGKPSYLGSVVGLASAPPVGKESELEKFKLILHWVFLPPVQALSGKSAEEKRKSLMAYTWGETMSLYHPALKKYAPVWVYHLTAKLS